MLNRWVTRAGLNTIYFSGLHNFAWQVTGGIGVILMLHHVRPKRPNRFQPNSGLEITPEFLTTIIRRLARSGFEFISLDQMCRRLVSRDYGDRFAVMTLDDGYRDNYQWAYPIFKQHGIPFAIYIPTSFPDRLGELWWAALEQIVACNDAIALEMNGKDCRVACRTLREKYEAYDHLTWWLRSQPSEATMFAIVRELSTRYGVDIASICETLCMTWGEIAELAADPLVTVGAHSVNHPILARLSGAAVRSELKMGRAVIESALGRPVRHLSYPYGDPTAVGPREWAIAAELGFDTAVTTRVGVLTPEHSERLTALPRIHIDGHFQRARYVDVLVSGANAMLSTMARKLVSRPRRAPDLVGNGPQQA